MTISAEPGPQITYGQLPSVVPGTAPPDYNPDAGPNADFCGSGLLDLRYGFKIGGANNNLGLPLAIMFAAATNFITIDQVPSVATTANIAALQTVSPLAPMALVAATAAGVTVMTAALFIPQTGLTVPSCLALDGLPGILTFGQNGTVGCVDPTKNLSRAVQIVGAAGATGGTFLVSGYNLYGQPQTELIVAVAGSTNGKKAFKFISSVAPIAGFADTTHNYSVGIADVYGLPIRADVYGYVEATFNNGPVITPGFVPAVTTSPATSSTGDVRGTISVTSDGVKRLQIQQGISPANLLTVVGNYGVTPA